MDSIPTVEEQRQRMGTHDTPVIAVVDDDGSLRRSLKNFLRSVGLRVETFASAEEFLTSGCLVLDLRMAGMSGLDLLRHLAAAHVRVPAVILTAHGNEDNRRSCLEAGAIAFIDKPFRADALLDAVQTALRSHGQRHGG